MKGRCVFCGREVEKVHTAAYKVSGWYVERDKGLHALIDRQQIPNQVAHSTCLPSKQARGQTSLLDGQTATVNSERNFAENPEGRMR